MKTTTAHSEELHLLFLWRACETSLRVAIIHTPHPHPAKILIINYIYMVQSNIAQEIRENFVNKLTPAYTAHQTPLRCPNKETFTDGTHFARRRDSNA
jgi:hypothetical protein